MNETAAKRGRPIGGAQWDELLRRLRDEGRDTLDTTVDRELLEDVSGSPSALLRRLGEAGLIHRIHFRRRGGRD